MEVRWDWGAKIGGKREIQEIIFMEHRFVFWFASWLACFNEILEHRLFFNPQQLICDSETSNLFEITFQHLPVESRHCSCWGVDFVRHHPTQTSTLQTFPRESMSGNQLVFCRGIDDRCNLLLVVVVDTTQTGKSQFFVGNFFQGAETYEALAKVNTVQTIFSEWGISRPVGRSVGLGYIRMLGI